MLMYFYLFAWKIFSRVHCEAPLLLFAFQEGAIKALNVFHRVNSSKPAYEVKFRSVVKSEEI